MINEINELLDQGKEVYLECIDKEGFLNIYDGEYYSENKFILESSLKVMKAFNSNIELCDIGFNIIEEEFKYFRIKQTTFNDIKQLALKALEDRVITSVEFTTSNLTNIQYITLKKDDYWKYIISSNSEVSNLQHEIDVIDNLYYESFTIESVDDLYRFNINVDCNDPTQIKLSNNQVLNDNVLNMIKDLTVEDQFIILKDATVTKRKQV